MRRLDSLNTWHKLAPEPLAPGTDYHEVTERRARPTKDEIRARFVEALNAIPADEASLCEFLRRSLSAIVLIKPPHRVQNIAPFGMGRIPGTVRRTVTRQKLDAARSSPRVLVYEFDPAGNPILETVTLEEPSGTLHILDDDGHGICGIKSALEIPPRAEHSRAVCSQCQRKRPEMPWPATVWPWEDSSGGREARLVFFAEAAAKIAERRAGAVEAT